MNFPCIPRKSLKNLSKIKVKMIQLKLFHLWLSFLFNKSSILGKISKSSWKNCPWNFFQWLLQKQFYGSQNVSLKYSIILAAIQPRIWLQGSVCSVQFLPRLWYLFQNLISEFLSRITQLIPSGISHLLISLYDKLISWSSFLNSSGNSSRNVSRH